MVVLIFFILCMIIMIFILLRDDKPNIIIPNDFPDDVPAHLYKLILQYQKDNNITSRCFDNVMIFRAVLMMRGFKNIKVKACVCLGDGNKINIRHFIILYNNHIIDPSYDVQSMRDKKYLIHGKDDYYEIMDLIISEEDKDAFDLFVKHADMMNNDKGYRLLSDDNYEYIDKMIGEIKCKM